MAYSNFSRSMSSCWKRGIFSIFMHVLAVGSRPSCESPLGWILKGGVRFWKPSKGARSVPVTNLSNLRRCSSSNFSTTFQNSWILGCCAFKCSPYEQWARKSSKSIGACSPEMSVWSSRTENSRSQSIGITSSRPYRKASQCAEIWKYDESSH